MEIKALSSDDYNKYPNSSDMVNKSNEDAAGETDVGNGMNNIQNIKANYSAINKDGDTLELSAEKESTAVDGKVVIEESKDSLDMSHFSDASLKKCSKARLQQLLASGKISRLQYDKAIKR